MPTPKFLNKDLVIKIHTRQIQRFGGTPGIKDQGLLESALAQPLATFDGAFLHTTIYEQAAAYLYHLAMNHPFIDGNKRTAFAAMDIFLRLNGYALNLTDEQAYNQVMQVAQGKMSKVELSENIEQFVQPTLQE